MKHYYRLSPVLWVTMPGNYASTVYGIDRMPEGPLAATVKCTARCRDDPAYTWSGATFMRLTMPSGSDGSCCNSRSGDGVDWQNLMGWLSWAQGRGYTVSDMKDMDPYKDIVLIYEC
jgi:hypothetical protein